MDVLWAYILAHWTQWVFAGIAALAGFGYRNVSKKLQEYKQQNEAIADGIQSLLRESIVNNYNKYKVKGYCPIYAKESMKNVYQSYHKLGGNDVATGIYKTILEMKDEPDDEKEG